MVCEPGFVLSEARVVSPMPRLHGFNRQHADLLVQPRDDDSVVRAQVVSQQVVTAAVELPPNFHRQVALRD